MNSVQVAERFELKLHMCYASRLTIVLGYSKAIVNDGYFIIRYAKLLGKNFSTCRVVSITSKTLTELRVSLSWMPRRYTFDVRSQ